MDKKIREYHAEELVMDHAATSGKIPFSGHLRNNRFAYAQVQDLVLPWFGWFKRSGLEQSLEVAQARDTWLNFAKALSEHVLKTTDKCVPALVVLGCHELTTKI